ncbi:TonB-dependent siderophore receptor [Colwellia sp. BRX9-1]|uniref:TonB-dependent receptor plug domain-containing protein n=1 Tax=Colwellia sp. BRX9-1 TaxID=2759830 RepID=UPI0015F6357B|nr:TonB-dependent receptor [Colwellia sp. BRX9-1]MBA6350755.1 TonB-dependent receptor [Colwellia sp. BRX9-1]
MKEFNKNLVTVAVTMAFTIVCHSSAFANNIIASKMINKHAKQTLSSVTKDGSSNKVVDASDQSTNNLVNNKIPIGRSLTDVIMLTPGTVKGDTAFGNLPAINGASVAENVFYVNGLNITNVRNNTGFSTVPFDMFESVEVITDGYSAQYGRYHGGMINAETKSGSNEFKAGINLSYEPDFLRESSPSVTLADGSYFIDNRASEYSNIDTNLWASGALIEDQLFFYVLFNPRKVEYSNFVSDPINPGPNNKARYQVTEEDPYWGMKLDGYITDNNLLEFTLFSDSSNNATQIVSPHGDTIESRNGVDYTGGTNWTLKYTSIITDDLALSVQYGVHEAERTSKNELDDNPVVYYLYESTGEFVKQGQFLNFLIDEGDDERQTIRVDINWTLGSHELSFGLDAEKLTANQRTINSGGAYYLLYVDDYTDPDNPQFRQVRHRQYESGGSYESENIAYYLEDKWQATDLFTVNFGLRSDSFKNADGVGENFSTMDNNWAPRLGLTYDLSADGRTRLWLNAGRFYSPIPMNANLRLGGSETYRQDYYAFDGFADPILQIPNISGTPIYYFDHYNNGSPPENYDIADKDLKPMTSDNVNIGFQMPVTDNWLLTIEGTYRNLAMAVEDINVDTSFNRYLEREFNASCTRCSGSHYYVLANPGQDVTIKANPDYDGPLQYQEYTIPAADLGHAKPERTYTAMSFSVEHAWDGLWMLNATYTWSKSKGNYEGLVRSDNRQDNTRINTGITPQYDLPGLMDGSYGDLPNDRRHQVKIYGAYQITEQISLAANFSYQTGRPVNAFGYHPTDESAQAYDAESFYAQGQLVPRGSKGRTDSVMTLDVSASYQFDLDDSTVILRVEVFNLLNSASVTQVDEMWDDEDNTIAVTSPLKSASYDLPTSWQTPRTVRLSMNYEF